jgi:hypothetical protein
MRTLLVHSGNECAFPKCRRVLVNSRGQWVGEVCHIEAAMPGGERFNSGMTNEARRAAQNLLLMCHEHHIETNDMDEFTVTRLREYKSSHESAFAVQAPTLSDDALEAAVKEIVESDIVDLTDRMVLRTPQTLVSYNRELGHGLSPGELRGSLEILTPALETLRRVPIDTRAVFAIAVDRSDDYSGGFGVPMHEIEHATGLDWEIVMLHARTLERYGLAGREDDYDGDSHTSLMYFVPMEIDGWPFWGEFKAFCAAKGIEPKPLINQLRFDVLD